VEEDSATATEEARSEADVLQLISQKPLGIFNCHKATRRDLDIGELISKGDTKKIAAPPTCPKCKTARGSTADLGSDGIILGSAGPCHMHL